VNVSFLQELLNTVAEQGRQLLPSSLRGGRENIEELALALVSGRGEASGVAIARQILDTYRRLDADGRVKFFHFLSQRFQPDDEVAQRAASSFLAQPNAERLADLQRAVESPRQEFFRRLNLAPGATAEIVAMRRDLLPLLSKDDLSLALVDRDLKHLLHSWFNRGFLVLRRIDWQTSASILEKIIHYEAVHEIQGFDDLRRRLDPTDRRCFAFFHPSLVDEPLIFVEVALTGDIPGSIQALLGEERKAAAGAEPTTAVFYSISNCQEGLKGISFGNFLIKQVVEELAREQPQLKTFVTLSPVPRFARWLETAMAEEAAGGLSEDDRVSLQILSDPAWLEESEEYEGLENAVLATAAHYLLQAKASDGRPLDPVARFHLGNGARLERINWLGDVSEKGLREAHGLMVNYRYEIKDIEKNHEAYANDAVVVTSRQVRQLLRAAPKLSGKAGKRLLALPSRGSKVELDG